MGFKSAKQPDRQGGWRILIGIHGGSPAKKDIRTYGNNSPGYIFFLFSDTDRVTPGVRYYPGCQNFLQQTGRREYLPHRWKSPSLSAGKVSIRRPAAALPAWTEGDSDGLAAAL